MRFVIFGVFTVAWFAVCIWVYTCHVKAACCQDSRLGQWDESKSNTEVVLVTHSDRDEAYCTDYNEGHLFGKSIEAENVKTQ